MHIVEWRTPRGASPWPHTVVKLHRYAATPYDSSSLGGPAPHLDEATGALRPADYPSYANCQNCLILLLI
jgi:hypothetical protein